MASGVPDRMRYNLKVTAANSTNKLTSNPCDGTDVYAGEPTSTISFILPHSSFAEFVDPTMSRFRFQLQLTVPEKLSNITGNRDDLNREMVCFDRGFESIIRRIQIEDMNGNILESIDDYNCLYALTELCTGEPDVRRQRGRFTMECFQENDLEHGTDIWPDANSLPTPLVGRTPAATAPKNNSRMYTVCFNLISGVFGGTCEKYWPLKAINGLKISIQLDNVWEAFTYKFVPCKSLVDKMLCGSYPDHHTGQRHQSGSERTKRR
jgi:hypothetical protein